MQARYGLSWYHVIGKRSYSIYTFKEIKMSESYSNIRMFKTNHAKSNIEQDDLISGGWDRWYKPNNATALEEFSAVCFLTARYNNPDLKFIITFQFKNRASNMIQFM